MPEPTTWHDLASARAGWRDAPKTDTVLQDLLDVAAQECLDFAPLPTTQPAGTVPIGYRMAQLMQARAVWDYQNGSTEQDLGFEGAGAPRIYPMDAHIRQRLRPRRGPAVG